MEREARDFADDEGEGGGAMSLDRAISAIRKRLRLVLAMPLVAGAIVALVVWNLPNRYDASAIVQIDPREKSIAHLDSVVSDLKGDQPTIESEVEIVRSRPIILQVIDILKLRTDPEFADTSWIKGVLRKVGIGDGKTQGDVLVRPPQKPHDQIGDILNPDEPGSSLPERDEVAVAFLDRLKVSRVRNTLLIDIRFSASDAVKAAKIANTIAEVYLKDQLDSKTRAASTATRVLEEKIEEMRNKVSEAERKVEQWKADHNVFDADGQDLDEKQLARLMEQTVIARNATAEARAKFEQVQKLARNGDGGAAIADVLQSHTVRLLKEQLVTATRKAAELRTKYGPKHPDILKVNAEVTEAQTQLAAETERLVTNLRNEYDVAVGHEQQLQQSLSQLKDQQVVSKDAGVELKDLQRDAASSKQLFEALLARYKQTAETQGFQLPDARIVEQADAPLFPAAPKRKQLVLIGIMVGMVLSCALAMLLELMAPGIDRGEDVGRAFDLAHLSSLPSIAPVGESAPDVAKAVRLIVAEPQSPYADAIRNMRRAIDMRRTSNGARTILVASSLPREGAEFVASNLAHHYAMTGSRVLLVDADMRRQPLTRHLASGRQAGLSDRLRYEQPLETAILRDALTGLHFLPAGGPGPSFGSVPEILSSRSFADAFMRIKGGFETIVVSAPPLMPVIDGRILADYADQIVFVMTWQKTPKQLARSALKALGYNEKKVIGVVLNDVSDDALQEAAGLSQIFPRLNPWAAIRPASAA